MDVTYRAATLADEAALMALDRVSWSTLVSPADPPPADAAFFDPGRTPDTVIVAELEGRAIGYVLHGPEIPIESNAHVGSLRGLAVDPSSRGLGLGRALVEAAIAELRSTGVTRVRSRVLATNPASLAVHRACGFEVEGVLRGEFVIDGAPVDDVLLARDLGGLPV